MQLLSQLGVYEILASAATKLAAVASPDAAASTDPSPSTLTPVTQPTVAALCRMWTHGQVLGDREMDQSNRAA